MTWLKDQSWADRAGAPGVRVGLATFGILALELALIRWTGAQIRVFAYFGNLVLIGAFMGMGLGVALGRRLPGLVHATLPLLTAVCAVLTFAEPLGLMHLEFPDPSVHLWGAEGSLAEGGQFVWSVVRFLAVFTAIVATFVCAGAAVGCLFPRLAVLRAYGWDLGGSLLGIAALTLATSFGTGPPVWLLLGVIPFVVLTRKPLAAVCAVAVVALGWLSVDDAVFSPYNRIDLVQEGSSVQLSVNRDFHQYMHNLSDEHLASDEVEPAALRRLQRYRAAYDLPFTINDARGSALIVGAGTGNDVQAALRSGYQRVVSVDIDPEIIRLGTELHPEQPYSDPRAEPVVNDARAFFEQYTGDPFDVVCYGLLDSHAMFTSLSSLRLDNYVYTEQGIHSAWEHVAPGGHLSLSFSVFAGEWISDRMFWTVTKATGTEPRMICHGMHFGCTFIVGKDEAVLHGDRIAHFGQRSPEAAQDEVRTTSDDWPFLYVRPGVFPWGYVVVLAFVLFMAFVGTPWAFGRASLRADFDPVLFLMGTAFLLIETRGVTSLSLVFGSTWLVNSAIFGGILLMVLLANLAVERFGFTNPMPWFAGLFAAVLLIWVVDPGSLNSYSLVTRGVIGGLINALPIGFAGVIVSILLARSANATASLGSNLLGSVLGGCLEYLSMTVGLGALALLALAIYLSAFLLAIRRKQGATA